MTGLSEIGAMLELWHRTDGLGQRGAVATVAFVKGSAYRHPGARMLVTAAGESVGMISGGCLEEDVREHALEVMRTGEPRLVTYDSTAPEDIVFGLGLGCNGVVQIYIEPVPQPGEVDILTFLAVCHDRRRMGRIATVYSVEGELDPQVAGTRVLVWPDGHVTMNREDAALRQLLLDQLELVPGRRAAIRKVALSGGACLRVLLETVAPPTELVVFGGGDDARPVVRLAKEIGWQVTVVDARSRYATVERFPEADGVRCAQPGDFQIPANSLVMLMTHSFLRDVALLKSVLPLRCPYVGVLGPRSRTMRMLSAIEEEGLVVTDEMLAALHGPAGLDISAETPEEIALAIIAEMRAVLGHRSGGPLRLRAGTIHDPVDEAASVA